ncbi:MAG: PAS domain-containing protein [Rhodobacteraceae bacterium]|nr:PAS domain-containing protein [Paracoccaceae bacterium]
MSKQPESPPCPGTWRDESLLKVITDNLPIGIAYVGPNRTYRFANQRFAAAYGLTLDSIIGMRAHEFISHDAMEVGDPFFEAAYKGTAVDFIHAARHVDGREMIVRTFLRPDFSAEGEVLGFFVCSFNVTREKEAESNLLQAQKMDAVGQLASGIAHDFNNLLAVVIGNLESLRDKITAPLIREEYLDPSIHAVEQGVQLTKQLLVIARRQPLFPEPLNIKSCLDDFMRLLRRTVRNDITFIVTCPDDLPMVFLDRVQFEVAMLNLCLNARDAMPDGGTIRIEVAYPSPRLGSGYLRLTVADTGIGMSAKLKAQIFEPFFTTKGSNQGTGLGLSMVWGFVQQSSARIDVESEVGVGTSFMLDLPVTTRAQDDPAIEDPERTEAAAKQGLIMVVDDNHALRRSIRRDLAIAGYAVIEAESAEEALPLIEAVEGLQALVSDVVMSGMTGDQLARAAVRIRPDLKVILMTSGDMPENGLEKENRFPILQKPFPNENLLRELEKPADEVPALDGN